MIVETDFGPVPIKDVPEYAHLLDKEKIVELVSRVYDLGGNFYWISGLKHTPGFNSKDAGYIEPRTFLKLNFKGQALIDITDRWNGHGDK